MVVRFVESPEPETPGVSRQQANNARRAQQAHAAQGGVPLFEDDPVSRAVDKQHISYDDARRRLGVPTPPIPPLGNEGVSVKLSDRYDALLGIAKAAAKRSMQLGAESDSGYDSISGRYAEADDVIIGGDVNAKKHEAAARKHYKTLLAEEAFIASGANKDRIKALGGEIYRDVNNKLGVGVGYDQRQKVLKKIWDGTPEKAATITRAKKREAARRKRLGLPEEN